MRGCRDRSPPGELKTARAAGRGAGRLANPVSGRARLLLSRATFHRKWRVVVRSMTSRVGPRRTWSALSWPFGKKGGSSGEIVGEPIARGMPAPTCANRRGPPAPMSSALRPPVAERLIRDCAVVHGGYTGTICLVLSSEKRRHELDPEPVGSGVRRPPSLKSNHYVYAMSDANGTWVSDLVGSPACEATDTRSLSRRTSTPPTGRTSLREARPCRHCCQRACSSLPRTRVAWRLSIRTACCCACRGSTARVRTAPSVT